MKEKLYTVPLNEAFDGTDECPFCALERDAEQRTIRFCLGPSASYMEPEVRGETNRLGFCGHHSKKVFDYGNALGGALILQTYFESLQEDLSRDMKSAGPGPKRSLFGRAKTEEEPLWKKIDRRVNSCFLCDRVDYHMQRYYHTFFMMVKEEAFRQKVGGSKGFCLPHFARLLQAAEEKLPNAQREWFYATVFSLMEENLARVKGDLDWLIAKYDYRNAAADWKNSRDALPRTMQKLQGGYVTDPPFSER